MAEAIAGREIKKPTYRSAKIALSLAAVISGGGVQQYLSRSEAERTTLFYPGKAEPLARFAGKLKGLTWNIHKGRSLQNKPSMPAVIDTISHQKFDFACINEASRDDAAKLVKGLGTYTGIYSPSYVNFNPLNRSVQGNLLLISSSVVNPNDIKVESHELYQANRGLLPRRVLVAKAGYLGLRETVFFTTHLEARNTGANTRQAYEVNHYLSAQSAKEAAIIGCGDINADGADINNPTVSAMAGDQLKVTAPGITFGGNSKIDVFISDPHTHIVGTQIISTEASDHQAAIGEFNLYAEAV